jgi:hypothetical protein
MPRPVSFVSGAAVVIPKKKTATVAVAGVKKAVTENQDGTAAAIAAVRAAHAEKAIAAMKTAPKKRGKQGA